MSLRQQLHTASPRGASCWLRPARRRVCIEHVQRHLAVSERRVCVALGQHRSTQRKVPRAEWAKGHGLRSRLGWHTEGKNEEALTADITALAQQFGRYGYRRVTALLRDAGWIVNAKRVERIWRLEGLKVQANQPKRGRLWLNDGSCIRLRPERRDHVWSYDSVEDHA